MKKITLLFAALLLFSAGSIFAQDDEIRTIFSETEIVRISGFGGPEMSFSMMNGDFAHFMGGGGGVLFNNFFIGGYGTGLTNGIMYNSDDPQIVEYGHGGLWFGYEFNYRNAIHPVVSLKTGWGGVESKTGYTHYYDNSVFVVTPMIGVEANITKFFKVRLGAECQVATGVGNLDGITEKDLLAPGANLSFLFGWF